jgi:hypothetical protein
MSPNGRGVYCNLLAHFFRLGCRANSEDFFLFMRGLVEPILLPDARPAPKILLAIEKQRRCGMLN